MVGWHNPLPIRQSTWEPTRRKGEMSRRSGERCLADCCSEPKRPVRPSSGLDWTDGGCPMTLGTDGYQGVRPKVCPGRTGEDYRCLRLRHVSFHVLTLTVIRRTGRLRIKVRVDTPKVTHCGAWEWLYGFLWFSVRVAYILRE